ncbi:MULTISPECIES: hypothetical protein [Tritonibacter]|uniref:Uncharacterized protein n=1 Tax=Tritonibacter scottomollicae TaxID=483013 RepID=A0A2T1AI48_TRISK|nr:hypothetical protein [Tritonibacter scottomollicae]PRZ48271.1 hypothetical protein CLV89_10495 [Tritonibacter scottomollicae]WOI33539.1 hypothetical protein R1T40_01945 [Tritonibacter scottomollicae]
MTQEWTSEIWATIRPEEAAALHAAILAAHAQHDLERLVDLYAIAADSKEVEGDVDATCFFLTQAFVFALEAGVARAHELNRRLVAYGRAWPLE